MGDGMIQNGKVKTIIYVILLLGLSVGAVRAWREYTAKDLDGQFTSQDSHVSLISTRTKADWIMIQSVRYGAGHPGQIVSSTWKESREAMEDILNGSLKPDLWSPESPLWIARLNEVWKQKHGGDIITMDDPKSFGVLLHSPIVFLTTKEKAAYLRPLLSGSRPWSSLRDLSSGRLTAPCGKVRFSHADPINSNSGTLSLALMLNEYIQEHGGTSSPALAVSSPGFAAYLSQIESVMLYDKAAQEGTYALTNDYLQHPGKRDFIVTHESAALSAAKRNPNLVVIYPSPTANSEETIGVLDAPWVNAKQREIGQQYIASLLRPAAMQSATQSNMRSANAAASDSLNPILDRMSGQGFRETYSTITLPSYDVLNTLAYTWSTRRNSK